MNKVFAIGALGGSGTRAIAQVLIESGVYMGDDLNEPNDNLTFTRLFKNPDWCKGATESEIYARLSVFQKYMNGDSLSLKDALLFTASFSNPTIKKSTMSKSTSLLKIVLSKKLFGSATHTTWGWKEPNSQIYLDDIIKFFPNLHYIHIVRHGLDMAFSNNKQQLKNWGFRYNIAIHGNESEQELAYKQLEYWVQSTKDVMRAKDRLGERFLLINHSSFCAFPKQQILRLVNFLDLGLCDEVIDKLVTVPKLPSTLGRYKQKDLTIFDKSQLDYVKELGFEI